MKVINTATLNKALADIDISCIINAINGQKDVPNICDYLGEEFNQVIKLAEVLPELKLNQINEYDRAIELLIGYCRDRLNGFNNYFLCGELAKLKDLALIVSKIGLKNSIDDFEIFSDVNNYIKETLIESHRLPQIVIDHIDWDKLVIKALPDYDQIELSAISLFGFKVTTFYWLKKS